MTARHRYVCSFEIRLLICDLSIMSTFSLECEVLVLMMICDV